MKDRPFDKYFDPSAVAMAYVPWQRFKMYENLEKAYYTGTIFPDLNKPFLGRRQRN